MEEQIKTEKRQVLSQSSWAEGEFRGIELGDQRLEKRFIRVCDDLSGQPEYPINQVSGDYDTCHQLPVFKDLFVH
jgi:hypothetical protein